MIGNINGVYLYLDLDKEGEVAKEKVTFSLRLNLTSSGGGVVTHLPEGKFSNGNWTPLEKIDFRSNLLERKVKDVWYDILFIQCDLIKKSKKAGIEDPFSIKPTEPRVFAGVVEGMDPKKTGERHFVMYHREKDLYSIRKIALANLEAAKGDIKTFVLMCRASFGKHRHFVVEALAEVFANNEEDLCSAMYFAFPNDLQMFGSVIMKFCGDKGKAFDFVKRNFYKYQEELTAFCALYRLETGYAPNNQQLRESPAKTLKNLVRIFPDLCNHHGRKRVMEMILKVFSEKERIVSFVSTYLRTYDPMIEEKQGKLLYEFFSDDEDLATQIVIKCTEDEERAEQKKTNIWRGWLKSKKEKK